MADDTVEGEVRETPSTALAPVPAFSREQINLIRDTVARDTTDTEFELFLYTAHRMGLDPLLRQIHAVKRWDSNLGRMAMAVQTGIDGYRLIADRTGKYAPGREPLFVYDEKSGSLISATAYVKKLVAGTWHEVPATAHYSEYVGRKKDGSPTSMWATKPHIMLAKCAEAIALRRAFPAEMAGVYTKEEMPEADEVGGLGANPVGANVNPRPAASSTTTGGEARNRAQTTAAPSVAPRHADPDIKQEREKAKAKPKDGRQVAEQILKVQPSLATWDAWLEQNVKMGMVEELTATKLRIALDYKELHESDVTLAKEYILSDKKPDKNQAAVNAIARLQQIANDRKTVNSGADLKEAVTQKNRAVRKYPKMTGRYGY